MTIHAFSSTSTAYDHVQWDDDLKKGDILLIESERVVGVVDTDPFAVTKNNGDFCYVLYPALAIERRMLGQKTVDAIKVAMQYGYELADWAVEFRNARTEIVVELEGENPVKTVFRYRDSTKAMALFGDYLKAGKKAKIYNTF